ncbi:unnamed protein product [Thlaspi arvense]|uniref:Ubiquitin-like domain-containing protein n=1 Tax=Thlaspi arvense TaxID=13288 RepID=A0AAU9SRV0_THLAR|nr:unnamed protein product [Thlaspi arvense]
MEIFFDNNGGQALFSMKAESSDTVLEMKQKIETSYGIAVSKQTIFFKGKLLLQDRLTLQQCKIVHKSRLVFFGPRPRSQKPNHNISQVLPQTEPSSVPSNSTQGIFNIQDSSERITTNQESTVMARSNDDQVLHQTEQQSPVPSYAINEFLNKDWSSMARSDDEHVVHQTEKSLESSNSIEDFLCGEDRPATTEGNVNIQDSSMGNNEYQDWRQMKPSSPSNLLGDFMHGESTNIQSYWPAISYENQGFQTEHSPVPSLSTEQSINAQDLSGSSNQGFQTEQSPVPSLSAEQRINAQDFSGSSNQGFQTEQNPVSSLSAEQSIYTLELSGSSNQGFHQTEQSPVPSPSTEQRINDHVVIDIPDSPVRRSSNKPPKNLRVMILPCSREDKPMPKFPVEVNASEKVEELKRELEEIQQRSQLYLPEEGYIFLHKEGQRQLNNDKSFRSNRVANGDTIQIFPGTYTMT